MPWYYGDQQRRAALQKAYADLDPSLYQMLCQKRAQ